VIVFDPMERFVDFFLGGRAVLSVPTVDEFLLPPFASLKIIGIECLFERMPSVEVVIQARIHAVEHNSSIGLGETERLPMTFVVVLLPALGQQHFCNAEILDIFVVLKSFAEHAHFITLV